MAFVHTKEWNSRQRLDSITVPGGAPTKRTAGGWIDDLAACGKAVVLCDTCKPKFNARAYGYIARKLPGTHAFVTGQCDGCGNWAGQATLHMREDQDGIFRNG